MGPPKPLIRRSALSALVLAAAAFFVLATSGFFVATRLEENDAFCASCHSQPEATYFGRTQSSSTDLASAHATLSPARTASQPARCIDCHSGPGLMGRVQSVSLGANDAVKWFSGTAIQPARQTTPVADANCLKCHAGVATDGGFDNHVHRHLVRWQAQDAKAATCVTCHTSHTTDGNIAIGFLNQQRAQAMCDQCHVALGVRQAVRP